MFNIKLYDKKLLSDVQPKKIMIWFEATYLRRKYLINT